MFKFKMNLLKEKRLLSRSLFVFVFSLAFGYLTVYFVGNSSMFNAGENSAKTKPDFLMNYYFTQLSTEMSFSGYEHLDSIIFLEASNLNRNEQANMIERLDSMKPKVIGIDIMHLVNENNRSDTLLVQALKNCKSKLILSIYTDENEKIIGPFYKDSLEKPLFGSVNFDEPWNNKTKHGDYYTFAYQVAKAFRDKELDTASFLVDYEPMANCEKLNYDQIFQNTNYSQINGKIVLVGTLNRTQDPIDLGFPIKFDVETEPNQLVPGMVVLAYQIRSFLETEHRFTKMKDFPNDMMCVIGIIVYFAICLLLSFGEERLEVKLKGKTDGFKIKVGKLIWTFFPLVQLLVLVGGEYLLVQFYCWFVQITKQIPNLWLLMASLPYVNCFDFIFSKRIVNNKNVFQN